MNKMSRRRFAKTVSGSAFLLGCPPMDFNWSLLQYEAGTLPETIAGTVLTSEQRELVRAFMESHNRMMRLLRDTRLENSLPPALHFASSHMTSENQ